MVVANKSTDLRRYRLAATTFSSTSSYTHIQSKIRDSCPQWYQILKHRQKPCGILQNAGSGLGREVVL